MDTMCSIDGCQRVVLCRGWCSTHYQRWQRHGDPNVSLRAANGAGAAGCSVDGCARPFDAKGYCSQHYSRWRKHGDPLAEVQTREVGRICEIAGCEDPHEGKGWCKRHYLRWYRYGDVQADVPLPPRYGSDVERIMAKIDVRDPDACWPWLGATGNAGYPVVTFQNRSRSGIRVVYQLLVGEILDGLELDHLCNNPPCCNPSHLEPVTHAENMARAGARRSSRGLTGAD